MDGADERPTRLTCTAIEITYDAAAIRNAIATFRAHLPSELREEWAILFVLDPTSHEANRLGVLGSSCFFVLR